MAVSKRKTPAKRPSKKTPVAEAVKKAAQEEPAEVEMVAPLSGQVFQAVMQIIDNANIKGADASNIVRVRMELARVANIKSSPRQ